MPFLGLITCVMNTFQERLKKARTDKGLSQEQLAKACGVSQGTIANLESGYRKQPRSIIELANALNVDPGWLSTGKQSFYDKANVTPIQTAKDGGAWPFRSFTEQQWMKLSKEDRAMVEGYAMSLIDRIQPAAAQTA